MLFTFTLAIAYCIQNCYTVVFMRYTIVMLMSGRWSGLSMHPVEHVVYFSTVVVQWLLALHPINALFQIHLAVFYAAFGHTGFEKLMLGKNLGIEGGSYFHYLHHKHFECNYGGSLIPLGSPFWHFS